MARLDRRLRETATEPHDDAGDATIAHQQVGSQANDPDRQIDGDPREEVGEIGLVGRREQDLGGTADAKPRDVGQGDIGGEPPLEFGQLVLELRREIGKTHVPVPRTRSSNGTDGPPFSHSGKACAQSVMVPAPMQMTR